VSLAFTGEEPVAQQPASALHETALAEISGPFDQHGANQVGVSQQHGLGPAKSEPGDVTLLPSDAQQKSWGVALKGEEIAQRWPARSHVPFGWFGSGLAPSITPGARASTAR
jgi:hypothetical protein